MARRRKTPAPAFYGVTGFCSDDYYADLSADDIKDEVRFSAWNTIYTSLEAAKSAVEDALRKDIELSEREAPPFTWEPCSQSGGFLVFHEMTETGYHVYPLTLEA